MGRLLVSSTTSGNVRLATTFAIVDPANLNHVSQCVLNAPIGNGSRSARRGRQAACQPRCRVKKPSELSVSNTGTSPCLPGLACSVFSAEAKASNRASAS